MKTYEIEGTFLVRCGTPAEWADDSVPNVGANRVLKKGEMGWEIGTSNFKIGDGETQWKSLDYIKPIPESSPYALRLGSGENYYTYPHLKTILASLEADPHLAEKVYTLQDEMAEVKSDIADLKGVKTKYYATRLDFPAIGQQGPIYIDEEKGDAYYFNVNTYEGSGVGYIKLNSFDILQAEL